MFLGRGGEPWFTWEKHGLPLPILVSKCMNRHKSIMWANMGQMVNCLPDLQYNKHTLQLNLTQHIMLVGKNSFSKLNFLA